MLQTQSPIGKFISLTYQEPDFLNNSLFKEKVENMVDLIKIKTQTRGIEHTSHSLQNDLFDIRIELVKFLFQQPGLLKIFEKKILDEISNKYYLSGPNKKLGQAVADSLEVYFKMFSHLSNIVSEGLADNLSSMNDIPSLNGLKYLLSLQPSKDVENYILWIEASLNFDYALIVSDLVFANTLSLKSNEIDQLELFVKKSIVDFGSYSILTNFWHPDLEDEIQLIRNIKIKAATLEIENGKSHSSSSEALHKFITA